MTYINCPIYGLISVSDRMDRIINTSEFQRLHNLRQLGLCYLVFPSANHTRFEHSLGVSHLTKQLMTSLQINQPELHITNNMIELTQIAGLIHDIGHGPFSHLYDEHFSNGVLHEERGITLFTAMVEKYNLRFDKDEVAYIINCVNPPEDLARNYLFQIVANKMCNIDVDKIDYIQRDSYHLGLGLSEKYQKLIAMCRVVKYDNNLVLGWPEQIQDEILSLFVTRYRLHKNIYCNYQVKTIEIYLKKLLHKIFTTDSEISWIYLTDNVISIPINDEIIGMKTILDSKRVNKMIVEVVLYDKQSIDLQNIEKKFSRFITILERKDIQNVILVKYNIGLGIKDTLKHIIYYDNYNNNTQNLDIEGYTLNKYATFIAPEINDEIIYRIYCEHNDYDTCCAEYTLINMI